MKKVLIILLISNIASWCIIGYLIKKHLENEKLILQVTKLESNIINATKYNTELMSGIVKHLEIKQKLETTKDMKINYDEL